MREKKMKSKNLNLHLSYFDDCKNQCKIVVEIENDGGGAAAADN